MTVQGTAAAGWPASWRNYQYDPRNRLTEYTKGGMRTAYEYDDAGIFLADGRARYTYDAFNRTERVETFDSHVQVNRYDPEGLRHEMEEDGKLVQYIYRGEQTRSWWRRPRATSSVSSGAMT